MLPCARDPEILHADIPRSHGAMRGEPGPALASRTTLLLVMKLRLGSWLPRTSSWVDLSRNTQHSPWRENKGLMGGSSVCLF